MSAVFPAAVGIPTAASTLNREAVTGLPRPTSVITPRFTDGQDVLIHSLRALYSAEAQLVAASDGIVAAGRTASVNTVFQGIAAGANERLATLGFCFAAIGVPLPGANTGSCSVTAALFDEFTTVVAANTAPNGDGHFVEAYATNVLERCYGYLAGAYGWAKQCATGLDESALVDRLAENIARVETSYRAVGAVSIGVFSTMPAYA